MPQHAGVSSLTPQALVEPVRRLGKAGRVLLSFGAGALTGVCRRHMRRSWVARQSAQAPRRAGGVAIGAPGGDGLMRELVEAAARQDAAAVEELLSELKRAGGASLFASWSRQLPSDRQVSLSDLQAVGLTPEALLEPANNFAGPTALALAFGLAGAVGFVAFRGSPIGNLLAVLCLAACVASIWAAAFAPELTPSALRDAQERPRRVAHESAHFLVGYLLGAPIRSYSVDELGPMVEFDERVGPMAGFTASRQALDAFCVVSSAGIAGEGQLWKGSQGGASDLQALGRALESPAAEDLDSAESQMNYTRWGVFYAATMLRLHRRSWEALRAAMDAGADLQGCIEAIETAEAAPAEAPAPTMATASR